MTPNLDFLLAQAVHDSPQLADDAAGELATLVARVREQERVIDAMGDKMKIMAESLTKCAEEGK
jgi:hypothetical protein